MRDTRRVGDRTAIESALRNEDNTTVDLTGASVTARMVNRATGAVKVSDAAATITDAAQGYVSYAWAAEDVDEPGDFAFTYRATIGGKTRTFPASGFVAVEILPR